MERPQPPLSPCSFSFVSSALCVPGGLCCWIGTSAANGPCACIKPVIDAVDRIAQQVCVPQTASTGKAVSANQWFFVAVTTRGN